MKLEKGGLLLPARGVAMLLSPFAMKALNSIERILPRMMIANFNGNPCTTVISCYSPTNVSDEISVIDFYHEISSLIRNVPKHNLLIVGGDFNAHVSSNTGHKECTYHQTTNRNGYHLLDFATENGLCILNSKYPKRRGKLWTFEHPNGSKAQLDYMLVNRKWINSCLNCEAYSSFSSVNSDHRIVSAKIRLSLRANKNISNREPPFNWSCLKMDNDICSHYTVEVKNRYAALQEQNDTLSPNEEYNNFIIAHQESAKLHIPLKPKVRKRVPWESKDIEEKRDKVREAAQIKDADPTRRNNASFQRAKMELKDEYDVELKNYIESKTDQIKRSSENKQSALAWQTVNEISGRKKTSRAKLKATSQQDRLNKWKFHFQNLLGKPPTIKDHQIQPVIDYQLDIKLGNFSLEELNKALSKMQNGKAPGLDGIPPEVWKTKAFNNILLTLCNKVYNGNSIEAWTTGCILPFPKKGDLGITNNYRGITLTSIAAKVYNTMLLHRIQPALERILRKNQNGFRKNRSTVGQILTIRRVIEGVRARNLPAVLIFVDFSKAFDSIHRGKIIWTTTRNSLSNNDAIQKYKG